MMAKLQLQYPSFRFKSYTSAAKAIICIWVKRLLYLLLKKGGQKRTPFLFVWSSIIVIYFGDGSRSLVEEHSNLNDLETHHNTHVISNRNKKP